MAKLFNRAKMTTSTTGAGTITLGSASVGFQTFASAGVSDADVVQYVIEEGANFEIGTGTYTASGTTLTRTPSESSNGGAAINLGGAATVSVTAISADYNRLEYQGSTKAEATASGISVTGTLAATAVTGDGSGLTGIVSIPAGAILLWSGAISAIPSGWALCDGTNGTPNLTGRFIIHADADAAGTYNVGDTGGASTVTLSTSEIPSHGHGLSGVTASTGSAGGHTHTGSTSTAGNHRHGFQYDYSTADGNPNGYVGTRIGSGYNNNYSGTIGYGQFLSYEGSHSHNMSLDSVADHTHNVTFSGNTDNAGSGSAHENKPPYYALAYIMKT